MQRSLPNTNPKTGYAYGVILGRNAPELLDDIFSRGDNDTFAGIVDELKEQCLKAVAEVIDPYVFDAERVASQIEDDLESLLLEHVEPPEESRYVLSEDDAEYMTIWLGGAPHIMVTQSPYLAYCAQCSPCVPLAGDLGSLRGKEEGVLAHSIPPEDYPPEVQERLKQRKEGDYTYLWVE